MGGAGGARTAGPMANGEWYTVWMALLFVGGGVGYMCTGIGANGVLRGFGALGMKALVWEREGQGLEHLRCWDYVVKGQI